MPARVPVPGLVGWWGGRAVAVRPPGGAPEAALVGKQAAWGVRTGLAEAGARACDARVSSRAAQAAGSVVAVQ